MKKIILQIEGMTCSACSNGLEKYLNKQKGIKSATVNLVMASASIEYEDFLTQKEIEQYIKEAGFQSLGKINLEKNKKTENKLPYILFGTLAFFIMYISMSHMGYPIPFFLNNHEYPKIYSLCLLLLTVPFLFYGRDILKNGIKNFIHKMPNMDTLVGIGIMSSFLYSFYGVIMVFLGHLEYVHSLYFESTAFVIYFIKLGRFLDHSSKEKTKEAIQKLVTITPKTAKKKTKDGFIQIPIDEVQKKDILVAYPGDSIAVDGKITKGKAHFDESFLTGESTPYEKSIHDSVIAGSINYDGVIEYEALKIGKESTISEIVKLVVEATNTKAPITLFADKLSRFFVPTILILAFLTFFISLFLVPFQDSLIRFVTVLVVACPCALGLATPLAMVVGVGVCARKGILVKTNAILEIASHIDTIIFDKTGTLTNGKPTISTIYNYSKKTDQELLSILGGIEKNMNHPLAKGIELYLEKEQISPIEMTKQKNIAGYGVEGIYQNKHYYACNAAYLKQLQISAKKEEQKLKEEQNSIIYLIEENQIIGLFGMKDTIREGTKELISKLKEKKINVIMLSGDNEIIAKKVGTELGIEKVISDVVPKEKAEVIQKFKKEGKVVMMVGDGVNDAPSLAFSDIGVSLTGATDIATNSADVLLMNNQLSKLLDLFFISHKTLLNIKENLFWAFLYNICMIPIATGFLPWKINPMIACIAMLISSFTVILNALRLKRIK